jgi:hypothetical protein
MKTELAAKRLECAVFSGALGRAQIRKGVRSLRTKAVLKPPQSRRFACSEQMSARLFQSLQHGAERGQVGDGHAGLLRPPSGPGSNSSCRFLKQG